MAARHLDVSESRLVAEGDDQIVYPSPDHLIIHGSHHKVGTVWFNRVLGGLARRLNWTCYIGQQDSIPPETDIFIQEHSRIDLNRLPSFAGSHIIRDPRDVVISGYFYHLKCDEEWCIRPRDEFDGRSYQDVLLGLDKNDGIEFEMRNVAMSTLQEMLKWDYARPGVSEVRYEDLIAHEERIFSGLFKHYGLTSDQIDIGMKVVENFSFKNAKKADPAEIHLRSGKPSQWRTHFTSAHIALCKTLYGDGLIELGYEDGYDWGD